MGEQFKDVLMPVEPSAFSLLTVYIPLMSVNHPHTESASLSVPPAMKLLRASRTRHMRPALPQQPGIIALLLQQLARRPGFGDPTVLHRDDQVGSGDGGQPVGDD